MSEENIELKEFEPITSQEDFNARLKDRLSQKERSVKKEFEGYTSPGDLETIKNEYQKKIDELTAQISESSKKYSDFDAKIADYESEISTLKTNAFKSDVLREFGISNEYLDNLTGTTEEEIRASAEKLSKLMTPRRQPMASTEESGANNQYLNLIRGLKGE